MSGFDCKCEKCSTCRNRKWRRNNREKFNAYQREYRKKRPELKEAARINHVSRTYGVDKGWLDSQLEKQNGNCDMCNSPMRVHNVDHNHTTGSVRGVICSKCNTGLHYIENNEFMQLAATYLQKYEDNSESTDGK
jgi:hypothetical protein